MNEATEKDKALFYIKAANAQTAADIIETAASVTGNAEPLADCMFFLAGHKKIAISAELEKYRVITSAAGEAAETAKQKKEIINNGETIKKHVDELIADLATIDIATPQVQEKLEAIIVSSARLKTTRCPRSRIYTSDDYLAECLNYDPSKDFAPALFGELAFPDGTVSYIGARTSRGKTTAMINLASESILAATPRKTIFITLEMSGKQITNKLILSTAFRLGIDKDNKNQDTTIQQALRTMNPGRDIYTFLKGRDLGDADGAKEFQIHVRSARNIIKAAQTAGLFICYDARGASLAEILDFIASQAEKGTVVLLDYIQKMPAKERTDTDSFRKIQVISYEVVNAAAATNAVIIAGAQFNRMGGTDSLGDEFDDKSYRESGDIEQDAHNAIGIGWKNDKQSRFYEVLKTREDKKQGTLFNLDFVGEYSFMAHGSQIFRMGSNTIGNGNTKIAELPKSLRRNKKIEDNKNE